VYLVADSLSGERARTNVHPRVAPLIEDADLICFPMGSFYTSVIANLLPEGIGAAVASTDCPKVYVPNYGTPADPEQVGMGLADSVAALVDFVRRDAGARTSVDRILDMVLLDCEALESTSRGEIAKVRNMGVEVVGAELRAGGAGSRLDAEALCRVLLSIV